MESTAWAAESAPFRVLVHRLQSPTQYACAYEYDFGFDSDPSDRPPPRHALVFVGGLGDGPHTVPYARTLAHQLAASAAGRSLGFSVFELRLRSAFSAYGFQRLADDVADLAALLRHLRGVLGRQKVVLLGHSTGCQDAMAYAAAAASSPQLEREKKGEKDKKGEKNEKDEEMDVPAADGYILQAPVSDRQYWEAQLPADARAASIAAAERLLRAGQPDALLPPDVLPAAVTTPHTAYRWHSLLAFNGDDDFFSSDLPDERLARAWRPFQHPVLVLPSEEDEFVPASVDMRANLVRWQTFCRPHVFSELSALIPGANHRVDPPAAQQWLADRVLAFLARLPE